MLLGRQELPLLVTPCVGRTSERRKNSLKVLKHACVMTGALVQHSADRKAKTLRVKPEQNSSLLEFWSVATGGWTILGKTSQNGHLFLLVMTSCHSASCSRSSRSTIHTFGLFSRPSMPHSTDGPSRLPRILCIPGCSVSLLQRMRGLKIFIRLSILPCSQDCCSSQMRAIWQQGMHQTLAVL